MMTVSTNRRIYTAVQAADADGSDGSFRPGVRCPDCNGVGRIVLFTSSRVCDRCGESGRIRPVREAEKSKSLAATVPATDTAEQTVTTYTYDLHGRLSEVGIESVGPPWPECMMYRY